MNDSQVSITKKYNDFFLNMGIQTPQSLGNSYTFWLDESLKILYVGYVNMGVASVSLSALLFATILLL